MADGLCISVVDPSLDKSMPLINKKIFPFHCQKNIVTVYRLGSFSFHLCYVHKAGAIQPLSSFRRVPCLIFLPLQIVDTEPVRMYCLLFQFLCLSHVHSYHLLHCISFRKGRSFHSAQSSPCKQCPLPLFLPSFPCFLLRFIVC